MKTLIGLLLLVFYAVILLASAALPVLGVIWLWKHL